MVALIAASCELDEDIVDNEEQRFGLMIVKEAIMEPLRHMATNAGKSADLIASDVGIFLDTMEAILRTVLAYFSTFQHNSMPGKCGLAPHHIPPNFAFWVIPGILGGSNAVISYFVQVHL